MDLSIGGLVRQATAPVLDAVSLVRTGAVEQIATFLRDNPNQRGTVETALAANGRAGDLSAIVERAGSTAGQVLDVARQAVGAGTTAAATAAQPVRAAIGEVVPRLAAAPAEMVTRAGQVAGQALGRAGDARVDALARPTPAGEALVRLAGDPGKAGTLGGAGPGAGLSPASDIALVLARGTGTPEAPFATRAGDTLAGAIRDGRLTQLITVAAREGRLAELLADARTTGRLPELFATARTLDGVLAAFAAKGGLSATELALLARAGLLSDADTRALRTAGMPLHVEAEDTAVPQFAPRDGPAGERFDTDAVPVENASAGGLADPALARFDAGAIRIASRAAVETYGVLGPPGGMVLPADAFEGLLRAAGGDLGAVERRLGIEGGALTDPDTLVAFVERRDLAGLRLPPDGHGAAAASWLPGGDKAGGIPAGLADLGQGTPFREMTFARASR